MELVECQPLLEWLANNYKNFGATLEIITDKSQEGSQFVRGFGGIGGQFSTRFFKILWDSLVVGNFKQFVDILQSNYKFFLSTNNWGSFFATLNFAFVYSLSVKYIFCNSSVRYVH